MIGITSYGGYIPRLRLKRMTIYDSLGWFAPAIIAVAQGERSICNWDEDALSIVFSAVRVVWRRMTRRTARLAAIEDPFALFNELR